MTVVADILIVAGAVLMLLAGLGTLRLPDVLARLQAGTKAASLALACVFAGTALLEPSIEAVGKLALAMLFVFATAPVAGHVIGRAAFQAGVPLWKDTWMDDAPPELNEEQAPAAGDGDRATGGPGGVRT